jgi:hypothetical protein
VGHIENGAGIALLFCAIMTVLVMISSLIEHARSWADLPNALVSAVFAAPLVFAGLLCFIAFGGGVYLLGWSVYAFLRFGYWAWYSGFAVLRLLDVPDVPYSGWVGFDAIVTQLLALPAALTILIGAPAVFVTCFVCWLRLIMLAAPLIGRVGS